MSDLQNGLDRSSPLIPVNLNSPFLQASPDDQVPIRTGIFGGDDVDMAVFSNFGDNILHSFTGKNFFYQFGAAAVTPLIVTNNIDYRVEHFFNQHPAYGQIAAPVPFTGQALPFIVGGSLLAYSSFEHDDETLGASFAVIQASIIELMDNVTLKAFTGRPGPNWRKTSNMEDLSEEFRFGFLRGGVYNGWPSGHTGATMAVVSALTNYYPDKTWLKIAGYGLVLYTAYGVTSVHRGGMHWFSDAVGGALMAYAIGSTVGKYYRNLYSSLTGDPVSENYSGLSFGIVDGGLGFTYSF
jgi:membrane-associated phospholipid phosphatase